MNKVNLKNMPCGQLYEFANKYYVWKILKVVESSRENSSAIFTEVFKLDDNDRLSNVWSGQLIVTPDTFNEESLDSREYFSIYNPDQDKTSKFHQEHDLELAPVEFQINALELEVKVLKDVSNRLEAQNKIHLKTINR